MMTREEILALSRKENKNSDEMEKDALLKAGQRACAVGGCVCMVIILLETIFSQQVNISTWAVYLSMTGTTLLTKYARLRKKHELILGLLELALAAAFLVIHVVRLVG